jgi:hypothetical protein
MHTLNCCADFIHYEKVPSKLYHSSYWQSIWSTIKPSLRKAINGIFRTASKPLQYLVQALYWRTELILGSSHTHLKLRNSQTRLLKTSCTSLRGTHFPVLLIDYSGDTTYKIFRCFPRSGLAVHLLCIGNHEISRIIVICEIFRETSNHFSKLYGYYQSHSVRFLIGWVWEGGILWVSFSLVDVPFY